MPYLHLFASNPETLMRLPKQSFCLFLFAVFFGLASISAANDLRIENVQLVALGETTRELRVVLDVSWSNPWNNERNHDAAWIFFKYVSPRGGYGHALLAAEGHEVVDFPGMASPPAQIDVAEDRTGFHLYPATSHRGDVRWRLSIRLDPETHTERNREGILHAFGIEMVYIPEAPFTLGDPDETALQFGAFYESDAQGAPQGLVQITSEASIPVGPEAGELYYGEGTYHGDRQGPIPDAFPKGFSAFYVMKYEITQGQYVDFLNTLPNNATFERFNFGGRTYYDQRGTIRLEEGRYVAGSPARPLNFSTWDDGLAFADWAALRPMTELEFTKASRGPESPHPKAFPWGTATLDQLARIVGPDDDLIMTNDWDESQLTEETRPVFGASYYWVMDLAGSVWERVITIGQPEGRAFTGSHGDGRLGNYGRATNADWPHHYEGREGHGYRGGGFYDQGRAASEFNPYSPVAYRRYGGWSGSAPHRAYGFRCARTAE